MKPKLKPPGTERLKLTCDKLLSTYAFRFSLRRYTVGAAPLLLGFACLGMVGWCRLTLSNPS